MPDKVIKEIIGFAVTYEKKQEILLAAENYKVDNLEVPLTISQFVRMAVDGKLKEINN